MRTYGSVRGAISDGRPYRDLPEGTGACVCHNWGRPNQGHGHLHRRDHRSGSCETFGPFAPVTDEVSTSDAELTLRSGTDNNLVHINIGRLLDRERNGAGDRIRRDRHLVHCADDLGLHFRICHGVREVRVNEAR